MGVFTDQTYEKLDWISQATEPFNSPFIALMAKVPNEVAIPHAVIFDSMKISVWSKSPILEISSLVKFVCQQYAPEEYNKLSCISSMIEEQFKLHISQDKIRINYLTNEITGDLVLQKISSNIDESVLKKILGRSCILQLQPTYTLSYNHIVKARALEVLDILEFHEKINMKKCSTVLYNIEYSLMNIFSTDKWMIRDAELAIKIGKWITAYIVNGDLSAISNLYKIKVMTHKKLPIYSIEESI